MGLEYKKDNKVDTRKNGRPINFSTGDGEDFFIDLPEDIPGDESSNLHETSETKAKKLVDKLNAANNGIDKLLKSVGFDDVSKW